MIENVLQVGNNTIIMNGGDSLPGCPTDWDEAKRIQESFNDGKDQYGEPLWRFDCGFKLDFDGSLITVSSRFYPPKTHYGSTWDGSVSILLQGEDIARKDFNCATIEDLRDQVETYVRGFVEKLEGFLGSLEP